MSRHPFVPEALRRRPFTTAEAAALGVSASMLRGPAWTPLTRGTYYHRDLQLSRADRVAAVRDALPADAVATGLLAAWAHGVWTPRPGAALPLQWALARGRARPRVSLDASRRLVLSPRDVVEVSGLLVTSPERTAFDLMRRAPLVEAVVVADAFAAAGAVELPWLWAYVDAHRRWPDVESTRRALRLASSGARSPGETRLRMVVVLGGLPEPYVNVPMYHGAELLAVPDLYIVGRRDAVAEYDGAYHEDDVQHRHDLRRENRLATIGRLPVLRYDRHTLARPALRQAALEQLAQAVGVRPPGTLRPHWFADPRRPFRW